MQIFPVDAVGNFSVDANNNRTGGSSFLITYNGQPHFLDLDVPDHPGVTYFVSWIPTDGVEVVSYTAKTVTGTDCSAAGTAITLPSEQNKLELANNGKTFCIQATDSDEVTGPWVSAATSFTTSETLSYALGGVTAVERIDAGGTNTQTTLTFSDHLSSATMTVDVAGNTIANVRYLPFGEERWNEADMPTDRGYTGQRNDSYINLLDYGSRWYNPSHEGRKVHR